MDFRALSRLEPELPVYFRRTPRNEAIAKRKRSRDGEQRYYSDSPGTDPKGPSSGSNRVIRGGSWDFSARCCRSAYRNYDSPGSRYRYRYFGFRLAAIAGKENKRGERHGATQRGAE
ncbi:MAG: hypothetical protein LBR94_07070 [Desulfovibrio sp.]|nr:hypothetical protein [Desulfovibrio sp.]